MKTDNIFKLNAPYNNPYQGDYKKLLFVCSAGILRSATAATLYSKMGYNTRTCGTHDYALIPLSSNLIAWADHIFFMNEENYVVALENFDDVIVNNYIVENIGVMLREKAQVLDIPDQYDYMHPELQDVIIEKVNNILTDI
jgi:predicted protein tyrosine phosphatase